MAAVFDGNLYSLMMSSWMLQLTNVPWASKRSRAAKARYILGLSATVTRKDGHHPIMFMQCSPVRYRVDPKKQAATRPFDHKVVFRRTEFRRSDGTLNERPPIQELYACLARDPARNDLIFDDILLALEAGRSPVVITERKDHLETLAARLSKFAKNVIILSGGMSARQMRAAFDALTAIPGDRERVLVATGRYLGEGFDDARLDTLFLTMPVSWRGVLAQYAGRLHRLHAAKRDVVIYDYVDEHEPLLAKMARRREVGYRGLGYRAIDVQSLAYIIPHTAEVVVPVEAELPHKLRNQNREQEKSESVRFCRRSDPCWFTFSGG